MPVLINDLEVEVQSPATEAETETSQVADPAGQNVISPTDMSMIISQQIERQERVRSH